MHSGSDAVGGDVAHLVDVTAVDGGLVCRQVRLLADRHRQRQAPKLRQCAGHRLRDASGDGIGEHRGRPRLLVAHRVHERIHPLCVFASARPREAALRIDHNLKVDPLTRVRLGARVRPESSVTSRFEGPALDLDLERLAGVAHASLTKARPLDQIVGALA